ncbi:hypothetical protein CEXT_108191 [Caerostris extrusa]|uniref:Uncharacterized protein n=1 Tax=Caerostris extrusa TaxID=172846 RepID=A0AAV4RWU4_CAEEX|nr:hypothetical protein CEXT_108191 [Caerostris extrusa]
MRVYYFAGRWYSEVASDVGNFIRQGSDYAQNHDNKPVFVVVKNRVTEPPTSCKSGRDCPGVLRKQFREGNCFNLSRPDVPVNGRRISN